MTTQFRYEDWKDERLSDFEEDLKAWHQSQKYAENASEASLRLNMDAGDRVEVNVAGHELYTLACCPQDDLGYDGVAAYLDKEYFGLKEHYRLGVGSANRDQAVLFRRKDIGDPADSPSPILGDEGSAPRNEVSGVSTYMWSDEPGTVNIVDSAKNNVEIVLENGEVLDDFTAQVLKERREA